MNRWSGCFASAFRTRDLKSVPDGWTKLVGGLFGAGHLTTRQVVAGSGRLTVIAVESGPCFIMDGHESDLDLLSGCPVLEIPESSIGASSQVTPIDPVLVSFLCMRYP